MTNTTIIDTRVRQSRSIVQPTRLPPLKTFVGQAIAAAVFAHFAVFVLACVMATENIGFWLFALPCFLFLSLFGSVPAGFIIWACTRSDARPLHRAFRCLIALLVLFPGWLYFAWVAFLNTESGQLWLLAWLVVPAVTIGLLTHSRLRVGRELVRGGEALKRSTQMLAAFSGVALRLTVVLLFMESIVAVISLYKERSTQHDLLIVTALLCGHFAAATFVVFVRTDIDLLAIVSAVAMAPLIIAFVKFREVAGPLRYVAAGYLASWAVFLLARWREADNALSFLNEEFHYYLID